MDVYQLIEKKQATRDLEIQEAYRELVRAMANGTEPEVETIEETLREAGRTVTQLREDVERQVYRQGLRELAAELPATRTEMNKLEEEIRKADHTLRQAHLAHQAAVLPIVSQLSVLRSKEVEIMRVESNLVQSCGDQAMQNRLKALRKMSESQPHYHAEPWIKERHEKIVAELEALEATMREW
jgi:valyl-tRNA synthetase